MGRSHFILLHLHSVPYPYHPTEHKMFNKWLIAVNLHSLQGYRDCSAILVISTTCFTPFQFFLSLQTSHILKTSRDTPAQQLTMDRTLTSSKPKADTTKEQIFLLQDKGYLSSYGSWNFFFFLFLNLKEFCLLALCKTDVKLVSGCTYKSLRTGYAN